MYFELNLNNIISLKILISMKNMINLLSTSGLGKGKVIVTLFFAFFLFSVQSSAQQYVTESQAISLIDSEVATLNGQLANLTGDANHAQLKQVQTEIGYYTGVKRQIVDANATVSQSIINNHNNFTNAPVGRFVPAQVEDLNQDIVDLLSF